MGLQRVAFDADTQPVRVASHRHICCGCCRRDRHMNRNPRGLLLVREGRSHARCVQQSVLLRDGRSRTLPFERARWRARLRLRRPLSTRVRPGTASSDQGAATLLAARRNGTRGTASTSARAGNNTVLAETQKRTLMVGPIPKEMSEPPRHFVRSPRNSGASSAVPQALTRAGALAETAASHLRGATAGWGAQAASREFSGPSGTPCRQALACA